ncbi:DUF4214 domain-containing protein [Acidithiobacillus ferridurans]|jgi:hypothetical protein|uniref:DUF4214 domain-containing protein n=2 Tax=Acidithiobacillus ferridurans TaxID=1232575 RepID=A0A8X8GE72_ACIFI|nr:DUF4214 domain-containing protein [Acidithiobacillus ferridurans]MBU2716515.1 DUF4214 domain-containing protein [Acidithiobacillus ferridurans]MBU2724231.1 DUF4214 domain-containing protein [Acidithiobacillus ferridurans]MBU2726109.1 DUF4214 domain-containing protein [Acidithiobacillus ferridurans]BBF64698.1 hypothetical protein AFERRID_09160 [Acidithiobacillus ferridurans]
MLVNNVYELFALNGRAFIMAAYENLLMRDPDEHGLRYYLGRLSVGYSKSDIIVQLSMSTDCRPLDELNGLKKFIADEHRAHHWFWGFFNRRDRVGRSMLSALVQIDNGFARIDQRLESLQDSLKESMGSLSSLSPIEERLAILQEALLAQTRFSTQTEDDGPHLSMEAVRQAFLRVLGREPENEDVYKYHARLASVDTLRGTLLNSEEFRLKLKTLPEHARNIFMRQIQLQPAQHGE